MSFNPNEPIVFNHDNLNWINSNVIAINCHYYIANTYDTFLTISRSHEKSSTTTLIYYDIE